MTNANSNMYRGKPAGDAGVVSTAWRDRLLRCFQGVVLLLSVALIVFISYDTLSDIPLFADSAYMTFQFVVCMIFVADFFVEFYLSPPGSRRRYLRQRWFFLLISIPWLNVLTLFHRAITPDLLYLLRFLPLARGCLAIWIVLGYITRSRITGLFVTYLLIMVLVVYFSSLIFYICEHPVNPWVTSFWEAIYWCCMQTTTMGCSQAPATLAGRILAVVLSLTGIVMFPLFTVYLSSMIMRKRDKSLNSINFAANSVKLSKSEPAIPSPVEKKVVEQPENH